MGPPQRQRFNAKARQSVAGGSSHKKRRNNASKATTTQQQQHDDGEGAAAAEDAATTAFDANRTMIVPESAEEQQWKEQERKRRELLAAHVGDAEQKLTAKKRKRLDAYIASRLKKEARAELLEELAKSSAELRQGGGRLELGSSKTLGTGKAKTGRELVDGVHRERHRGGENEDQSGSESEEDWEKPKPTPAVSDHAPSGEVLDDPQRRQRILEAASFFDPAKPTTTSTTNSTTSAAPLGSALAPGASTFGSFGSALATGPDGKPLMPTVRKRKRQALNQRQRRRLRDQSEEEEDDESSEFNSSESSSSESEQEEEDAAAEAAVVTDDTAQPVNTSTSQAQPQESASDGSSSSSAESAATGAETDSESEAIFMEAMRLRGMPMDEYDRDDDSDSDSDGDSADSDSREASRELAAVSDEQGMAGSASPPWEGFASEDDESFLDRPDSGSGSESDDDDEEGDEDDEEDDKDEGDDGGDDDDDDDDDDAESNSGSDAADEISRRRGIQRTGRSSGFKDWARTALGFGAQETVVGDDGQLKLSGRTEEGVPLEPVAGFSVKVKDINADETVPQGPLGEKEPQAADLSPFAAKYYAEVASSKSIKNVPVSRSQEVIESRLKLPVVQEEERLVRMVLENEVSVICGETGSGKTTQVAQMLFERGFGTPGSDNPGLVGITQPRRVAAVSTARRVAEELNLSSNRVSHQIRYDGTVSPETSLKFMTDGVLLRELSSDLLLTKYSIVVIDEAHERSVNTDVLIGMLSRVVKLRATRWLEGKPDARPLRLIIMSATLRVADFVENATLFAKPPPMLKIEARQHPVTVHFNRRTPSDYLEETVKKASKIHARLPPGGILIFLTGEQEIKTVCKRLEEKFGRARIEQRKRRQAGRIASAADDDNATQIRVRPEREDIEAEELDLGVAHDETEGVDQDEDNAAAAQAPTDEDALDTDSEAEGEDGGGDDNDEARMLDDSAPIHADAEAAPMHILPLYSLLPSEKQLEVFKPPPDDARLVVVATNVAETSLTIPNVKYVIDCGRAKERKYDDRSGISSFKVDWISKASAAQRTGRAGRTGPGHCYRIYSSNVFEEYFDDFAEAEIRRTPVEGLVLQMKSMNIDNVVNFPFPTAPDRSAIAKAERVLTRLGALSVEGGSGESSSYGRKQIARITELGRTMSLFPLNPRFAKLLVQGQQHGCLPFVVALVAAMSVGDLFVRDEEAGDAENADLGDVDEADEIRHNPHLRSEAERTRQERKTRRRQRFEALARFDSLGGVGVSDAFRVLAVVGAYAYAGGSLEFCKENFLRTKAMEEVRQLRSQLGSLVISTLPPSPETSALSATLSSPRLAPPNDTQFKVLRQLIACAYIDQVAVRADLVPEAARSVPALAELASEGRLRSRWSSCRHVPYLAMGVSSTATDNDPAYIHQTSSLFEHAPPEWCIFSEVMRARPKTRNVGEEDGEQDQEQEEKKGKVYLRGLTKINPNWIAKIGKEMCSFSKPMPLDDVAGGKTSSLAQNIASLKSAERKDQVVVMTPTYGTGPAVDASERVGGGIGWELPPVKAKRRWVGGLQGWKIDM